MSQRTCICAGAQMGYKFERGKLNCAPVGPSRIETVNFRLTTAIKSNQISRSPSPSSCSTSIIILLRDILVINSTATITLHHSEHIRGQMDGHLREHHPLFAYSLHACAGPDLGHTRSPTRAFPHPVPSKTRDAADESGTQTAHRYGAKPCSFPRLSLLLSSRVS